MSEFSSFYQYNNNNNSNNNNNNDNRNSNNRMRHHHHFRQADDEEQQLTMAGLAYRRRWSALALRAAVHPEEIDQLSSLRPPDHHHHDVHHYHHAQREVVEDHSTEGWTLLHWVCCNSPPIEMLQALFRHDAARRAARMQDRNGMTPLLCACACQASLETISILLEEVPECIHIYDADGWTALHYICSQVGGIVGAGGGGDYHYHGEVQSWAYSMAVVQRLLQCDAALSLQQDSRQRNPIKLLCGMYEIELQSFYFLHGGSTRRPRVGGGHHHQQRRRGNQRHAEHEHDQADDNENLDRLTLDLVRGLWPLLQCMIDAAFQNNPILAEATIFHRIVALPNVAVELLMFALALHPPELALQQQDAQGNTPLHVAILQQQQQHQERQQEEQQQNPPNRPLIHFLLLGQPQAAEVRNAQGLLPLQLILDEPWNSVHAALLKAFPAAVESCGVNEEHYSRIMALCGTFCDSQTIFEILRARPNLVMRNLR